MFEDSIFKEMKKIIPAIRQKKWGAALSSSMLFGAGFFLMQYTQSPDTNSQAQKQHQETNVYMPDSKKSAVLGEEEHFFQEDDWELGPGIKKDRERGVFTGYYCASPRKNFETSEVWLKEKIKIGERVTLRISLKQSSNQEDFSALSQEPKIIEIYGKEVFYRFFFPDKDNQRVLFDDSSTKERDPVHRKLRYPLIFSPEGEIQLEFSVYSFETNRVTFKTGVTYLAEVVDENERGTPHSTEQFTDNFDFEAILPWSNLKNSLEKEFGLGAYPGTCFKIVSAKVSSN